MLDAYQDAAARTANKDGDPKIRLAVAGMGLAGEVAEVYLESCDLEPFIKEAGDVAWYTAEIATLTGIRLSTLNPTLGETTGATIEQNLGDLVVVAGKLVDYLKKVVGHGHTLDPSRVRNSLTRVIEQLDILARQHGTTLSVVLERNTAKLAARYPAGFSTQASIHRTE